MGPKSLNIPRAVLIVSMLESEGPLCGPTSNRFSLRGGPRSCQILVIAAGFLDKEFD